jgi:hypothetical protein
MSDLSNDTKKHTTKSRETIPLMLQYRQYSINKTKNRSDDANLTRGDIFRVQRISVSQNLQYMYSTVQYCSATACR